MHIALSHTFITKGKILLHEPFNILGTKGALYIYPTFLPTSHKIKVGVFMNIHTGQ